MNVTPSELAFIAATLARNDDTAPSSKLFEAYGLINEADKLLHPEPVKFVPIPLRARLAELMPAIKDKDYRMKKFFKYLVERNVRQMMGKTAKCGVKPPPPEEAIQEAARHYLEMLKKEGVSPTAFFDFDQWQKADKHNQRAVAGRKGAAKKQANATARAKAKAIRKESQKRQRIKPELHFVNDEAKLAALAAPKTGKTPIRGANTLPD